MFFGLFYLVFCLIKKNIYIFDSITNVNPHYFV